MDRRQLIPPLAAPLGTIALSAVLLTTSLMFTSAAQQEGRFNEYYTLLLVFNVCGVVVLVALIAANVWSLARQFRSRVLGSRLTVRLIAIFALLSLLPLGVVYYFAIQFLDKSVDSWFDVRIERALDDAMLLGQNSLEAVNQDLIQQVRDQAARIEETTSELEIIHLLDEFREAGGYMEMIVFGHDGHIVASSQDVERALIPDLPNQDILNRVQGGLEHSQMESVGDEALQLRAVIPLRDPGVLDARRYLQVLYPLPLRFSKLGSSVQTASEEYERLLYLRTPLKLNFMVTLSTVALMTGLIALWIAIYSSRRMMQPLRQLAEGTSAVARGNYETRLSATGSDELGVLVHSFNDMTREIRNAQQQAADSRRQVEKQRTYLETILAHLSSGVLSLDDEANLVTCNETANRILGLEMSAFIGAFVGDIGTGQPWTAPLFESIARDIDDKAPSWRRELRLEGAQGRQTLNVRGTRIPGRHGRAAAGYVVVFDDITELVQAQRKAAWGEVARRLAHEIKNPLTPIQLSAERIRRKYLPKLTEPERDTLERATRTISQQVESMKSMVNAFSEYAQPTRMNPVSTDLNHLIRDVAELHRSSDEPGFRLDLEDGLPEVVVDPTQMRQVLNNLIINARDALGHGAENPRLEIRTRGVEVERRDWVRVEVEDNGPGFPKELLDRIFEPYVTTKQKGTGLGLAIIRRIVEEHGGLIKVHNRPRGGATISIRLPVTDAVGAEPPAPLKRVVSNP